jgi:hypothetical protein
VPSRYSDGARLVRCEKYGRSEVVSAADVTGYVKGGWPRCCGEVMTYFIRAERDKGMAPPDPSK